MKNINLFYSSMLILTTILLDLLGGAEIDIFIPSFPELQRVFNISVFWAEGLLSANMIGSVFGLIFVGNLSDRYGYKPVIITGLCIFIIGSIFCLYASSYAYLITGRILQGIGIAAPTSLAFVIIAENYPIKKQQFLMGIMSGFMNAAVAAAPVLGSYITIYYHWQGNFTLLLLAAIIVLAMLIAFVPNRKAKKEAKVAIEYSSLFSSNAFMLLLTTLLFRCLPYWMFLGMSSIIYVEALGVDLVHYGYYQGTWALVFALGSIIAGTIVPKFSSKNMLILSAYFSLLSLIAIALVTVSDCKSPLLIALAFIVLSIAEVIPCVIVYPLFVNFFPEAKGKAASLFLTLRLVFTSIFIQIAGYFYNGSFQNVGIIITLIVIPVVITSFMIPYNKEILARLEEAK